MLESRPLNKRRRRASGSKSDRSIGKWPVYFVYLMTVCLLFAGGVAVYQAYPLNDADALKKQVISIGEGFVRDTIRSELKTSFGEDEEVRVEPLPGRKFLVAGWVDVMNDEGLVERHDFSCVVYKGEADTWFSEKVSVIPQSL